MAVERMTSDDGMEEFALLHIEGRRGLSEITDDELDALLAAIVGGGDLFVRGLAIEVVWRMAESNSLGSLPRKLSSVRTLSSVMHHPQRLGGLSNGHLSTLQKQAAHVFARLLNDAAKDPDELQAVVDEHLRVAFDD